MLISGSTIASVGPAVSYAPVVGVVDVGIHLSSVVSDCALQAGCCCCCSHAFTKWALFVLPEHPSVRQSFLESREIVLKTKMEMGKFMRPFIFRAHSE